MLHNNFYYFVYLTQNCIFTPYDMDRQQKPAQRLNGAALGPICMYLPKHPSFGGRLVIIILPECKNNFIPNKGSVQP